MSDYLLDLLFCLALFGPILLTGAVATSSLGAGSYQRKATGPKLVFLKPVSGIVFGITLVLYLLMMGACIDDLVPMSTLSWHYVSTHPDVMKVILAFVAFAIGLYWISIRWYQKTCFLALDKDRRTYRTIDKNGVKLKIRTGSWNEIAGISVQRLSTPKGATIFYVRLKWNRPSEFASSLGGFNQKEQAEAFASRMAAELHLPIVAAPDLA